MISLSIDQLKPPHLKQKKLDNKSQNMVCPRNAYRFIYPVTVLMLIDRMNPQCFLFPMPFFYKKPVTLAPVSQDFSSEKLSSFFVSYAPLYVRPCPSLFAYKATDPSCLAVHWAKDKISVLYRLPIQHPRIKDICHRSPENCIYVCCGRLLLSACVRRDTNNWIRTDDGLPENPTNTLLKRNRDSSQLFHLLHAEGSKSIYTNFNEGSGSSDFDLSFCGREVNIHDIRSDGVDKRLNKLVEYLLPSISHSSSRWSHSVKPFSGLCQ